MPVLGNAPWPLLRDSLWTAATTRQRTTSAADGLHLGRCQYSAMRHSPSFGAASGPPATPRQRTMAAADGLRLDRCHYSTMRHGPRLRAASGPPPLLGNAPWPPLRWIPLPPLSRNAPLVAAASLPADNALPSSLSHLHPAVDSPFSGDSASATPGPAEPRLMTARLWAAATVASSFMIWRS